MSPPSTASGRAGGGYQLLFTDRVLRQLEDLAQDRWYHRAAVAVWPREVAFANRAEASPARAFDELTAMASAGDVTGARTAAATLAPFLNGVWCHEMQGMNGTTLGLFGRALRAAEAVADTATASMLLRPFRVACLTSAYVGSFAKIAESYGQQWTEELLRAWFGADERAGTQGDDREVRLWAAGSLPGICEALERCGRNLRGSRAAVARPCLGPDQAGHPFSVRVGLAKLS